MPEDREKERVGVTLFKDQHRWLKQQALDHGVNGGASAVVRTAIDHEMAQVPLLDVLRAVEWEHRLGGVPACPYCKEYQTDGHDDRCRVGQVLRG